MSTRDPWPHWAYRAPWPNALCTTMLMYVRHMSLVPSLLRESDEMRAVANIYVCKIRTRNSHTRSHSGQCGRISAPSVALVLIQAQTRLLCLVYHNSYLMSQCHVAITGFREAKALATICLQLASMYKRQTTCWQHSCAL